MAFVADLHIHSHLSRATARDLDLEHLHFWAKLKGVQVLGTGDFTHPEWFKEIREKLEPAEEGLLRLKREFSESLPGPEMPPGGEAVRFILSTEVSSIYKKAGRVRKVHNLILMPELGAAEQFNRRLSRLGNISSDGRPILGLDAKTLLELSLEITDGAIFIPAHIWTPWFSLLGSMSGFDSVEECFEELSPHISSLETGLSSDPPMNWRLSSLDSFTLVSNSDAHSPSKIAREANLFGCALSFPAMREALRKGQKAGFLGTIEFFPQEGKYHFDGHRKCSVRLSPEETRALGGLCPECKKPVTVGVMHRVVELSDREEGASPPSALPFHQLLTLPEILAEVHATSPGTKKVERDHRKLLSRLGPELNILLEASLPEIEAEGGPLLAEGVRKMREGDVHILAGYDGEFGTINLFTEEERKSFTRQGFMWALGGAEAREEPSRAAAEGRAPYEKTPPPPSEARVSLPKNLSQAAASLVEDPVLGGLNPGQREAVTHTLGPLLIKAGPGTGKTLTLARRIAYLLGEGMAKPAEILAITFTNKAAEEMAERLGRLLKDASGLTIKTFHALGAQILRESLEGDFRVLSEGERLKLARGLSRGKTLPAREFLDRVSSLKQKLLYPGDLDAAEEDETFRALFIAYEEALKQQGTLDFDDLIARPLRLLRSSPMLLSQLRSRFRHILVDEHQDINEAQYLLLRLLAAEDSPNLFAIGDPDQAIYGFRGARAEYFFKFFEDFPGAKLISLEQSYRSTETILKASGKLITEEGAAGGARLWSGIIDDEMIVLGELRSDREEADYVAAEIERLIGGVSHRELEAGRVEKVRPKREVGFSDIAILYRLHAQAGPLEEALSRRGIPCQRAAQEPLHETDPLDFRAEKVNLLTLHAAKGLEFPVVFMTGCEEGLIPYQKAGGSFSLEEERRLFYVGMTRAKRKLFLTRAKNRTLFGKKLPGAPSPFILEIEGELTERAKIERKEKKPRPEEKQLSLL